MFQNVRNLILEELSDALDDRSGQFRYFFVLPVGRVEPYAADDPLGLEASTRRDVLAIHPLSHADAQQLVIDFISSLSEGELAEKLREAVAGAAPSGRFLHVLRAYPRARRSWLAYRSRRLEAIALEWLREHGVDVASLGLDRPAREQEDATGLRFDPSLDERLERVRARAAAFAASPFAASARAACRHTMRIDEIYH